VLSFINQFSSSELSLIEDKAEESFIISSIDEVQKRVLKAEQTANFIDADTFWLEIDKKIEAM
jgi:hypothetical protein